MWLYSNKFSTDHKLHSIGVYLEGVWLRVPTCMHMRAFPRTPSCYLIGILNGLVVCLCDYFCNNELNFVLNDSSWHRFSSNNFLKENLFSQRNFLIFPDCLGFKRVQCFCKCVLAHIPIEPKRNIVCKETRDLQLTIFICIKWDGVMTDYQPNYAPKRDSPLLLCAK